MEARVADCKMLELWASFASILINSSKNTNGKLELIKHMPLIYRICPFFVCDDIAIHETNLLRNSALKIERLDVTNL
jgi:hypothetical protein